MGVIRECGGKMHMHERAWADAATDFFEAFKSYDEVCAGVLLGLWQAAVINCFATGS